MLVLIDRHKDLRRTHWLSDPKNTYKERDEEILKEAQRKKDEHEGSIGNPGPGSLYVSH